MSISITQFNHLRIPLDEIQKATNNFSEDNKIGRDDFGYIYEGQLFRSGELINVSARRLDRSRGLGDIEFLTEVSVLSSLNHPSIVSLIGFCDENGEKIIVNSYEAKGGLCMYLDDPSLTWIQRLEICIGVAKALSYLQNEEGRNYSIIHRNINSSTILLDENNKAKLSGFEYSIKHSTDRMESYIPSEVIDSPGYMAPESIESGIATEKSDVYSFGVVICELICGRKAFLPDESEDNKFLAPLFRFHKKRKTLDDIIHPDLRKTMTPFLDELKSFANTASFCIHPQPKMRYDIQINLLLLWRVYDSFKKSLLATQQPSKGELGAMVESTSSGAWKGELEAMVESTSSGVWKANKFEHLRIPFKDIQLATNYFSKESTHMEERFYTVYRGDLECFDRDYVFSLEDKNKVELPKRRYTNVRIKCITDANAVDRFHTEIEVLSACKHRNILSLLGFCDEGRHMILVHEASGKEYLEQRLNFFGWLLRVSICRLIALGLDYIHNEMEVIHRQLSSKAILIDLEHGVKICEFGLSTFLSSNQDEDTRHLGENLFDPYAQDYMAPEFRETGIATKESDIYSFGLLMFEILTGVRCPTFCINNPECKQSEHSWFKYGTIKQNVSKRLKEENHGNKLFLKEGPNEDSLDTFIKITEQCLAVNPEQRPPLLVIIMELYKALTLQMNHKDHLRMSLKDIESATQNFSRANYIGGGGFGRMYRGVLASEHGSSTFVAKRLDTRGGQGGQQFYNELHILSEYKHENVIGLVGYNNDEQERIVVYEYASKGSLDRYLNDASLTWINRLNICIDIARGLAFLHAGVREHEAVIHRDMKSANILLFDDWKAKVADFGLSLIYTKNDQTDYVIDNVSGTPGYLDPVYQKSRFLTKESDIYSLGVILFEILYGKSTYEIKKRENQFLQSLVKQRHDEGRLDEVVFNAIKNQIVPEALAIFQAIGYQCLHDDREQRPTAQQVLVQLQKALELQVKDVPVSKMKNLDIC